MPMWKTFIPESLYGWRSAIVKLSGSANHFACFGKLSVSGLSISMTVDCLTRSIARVEYSVEGLGKTRERPKLIIGATNVAMPAKAVFSSIARRVSVWLCLVIINLALAGE